MESEKNRLRRLPDFQGLARNGDEPVPGIGLHFELALKLRVATRLRQLQTQTVATPEKLILLAIETRGKATTEGVPIAHNVGFHKNLGSYRLALAKRTDLHAVIQLIFGTGQQAQKRKKNKRGCLHFRYTKDGKRLLEKKIRENPFRALTKKQDLGTRQPFAGFGLPPGCPGLRFAPVAPIAPLNPSHPLCG